jgi:hypothetical protein
MALIDNLLEIKKHDGAIASGIDLVNIQSFIDEGIERHLIPAIGYTQFTQLVAAKLASTSEKQTRVLDMLQKSAVGFMVYYWADQGAVEFSDKGIHVSKSATMLPASDKKIISLKKQNIFSAYAALELAVSFLSENGNDFPLYKESQEHAANRGLLINTSKEFQAAGVNINNDARLYQTLRVYQSEMESTYIEPVLGFTIKEALHVGILANSLSDHEKELLKRVRKAVAYYTMADAIPYMAVSMDASGIFELNETVGGISGNVENRTAASDKRLLNAMNGYVIKAEQHIATILKYLDAHKADFNYITPEVVNINDSYTNVFFI